MTGRRSAASSTGASPSLAAARPRFSLRSIGPGAIVAAAFIGPGTVTTATLAGASYGYTLMWALTFSIVATLVLQEMAARLGLVTGRGLGEAVRRRFSGALRVAAVGLVIAAVAFGNAAYETGNLLGAGLGAEAVWGGAARWWALGCGGIAALLLLSGSYRLVERALIGLVVLMSATFLVCAVWIAPPILEVLKGMFVPAIPSDEALTFAVGLIGTTVVPYNLFLHASAVSERWSGAEELPVARRELVVSILGGGLISLAVVATAAAMRTGVAIESAADMAVQLEPVLGRWARSFFAVGLLAAGLTSAITAPLAAAYATAGALGWPRDLRDRRLRFVWLVVIGAGMTFAGAGIRPVPAILFAQVANGLLLPAIAAFLLLAVNDGRWLGERTNGTALNVVGAAVVLITLALGLRALLRVF